MVVARASLPRCSHRHRLFPFLGVCSRSRGGLGYRQTGSTQIRERNRHQVEELAWSMRDCVDNPALAPSAFSSILRGCDDLGDVATVDEGQDRPTNDRHRTLTCESPIGESTTTMFALPEVATFSHRAVVAGAPDTVIEQIQLLAARGLGPLLGWFDVPGRSPTSPTPTSNRLGGKHGHGWRRYRLISRPRLARASAPR